MRCCVRPTGEGAGETSPKVNVCGMFRPATPGAGRCGGSFGGGGGTVAWELPAKRGWLRAGGVPPAAAASTTSRCRTQSSTDWKNSGGTSGGGGAGAHAQSNRGPSGADQIGDGKPSGTCVRVRQSFVLGNSKCRSSLFVLRTYSYLFVLALSHFLQSYFFW